MNFDSNIATDFIVAILGLAYPILLEVISRLDDKYQSLNIVALFNKEKIKTWFLRALYSSLILIVIKVLNFAPLSGFEILNSSASVLLFISSGFLVVSFLFLVKKIFVYYNVALFIDHLINRHKQRKESSNLNYFNALCDLLYYSIKTSNETIALEVSKFMQDEFANHRQLSKQVPIVYPNEFYNVLTKSIVLSSSNPYAYLRFLEYRTGGAVWLLGDFDHYEISEITYSQIWNNSLLVLEYNNDYMIVDQWQHAHNYFQNALRPIQEEFYDDPILGEIIKNQNEVDHRKQERERFLEFHLALGGLLLYNKKYKIIKEFFKYTTSLPEHYPLLPYSMDDVFKFYFLFLDPYDQKFPFLGQKYFLKEHRSLGTEKEIKYIICEYIIVLFLRQYSMNYNITYYDPVRQPYLPQELNEKKMWLDNISIFESQLHKVLSNDLLLEELSLDFINNAWCLKNKIPTPIEFIDELKNRLSAPVAII